MSARRLPRADAATDRRDPAGQGSLSDVDPEELEDSWLTVAEIASELRVNPATVRLWVSKGTLPATRAGQRKLIIRRSDLDLMLEAPQPRASGVIDSSLCVRCIELFLVEREISQEALLAELDAVLAHIREALLVYWRARRAINAQEHRES
jgi:excisionase family DNA binding protein